jgi:hypothetical protein
MPGKQVREFPFWAGTVAAPRARSSFGEWALQTKRAGIAPQSQTAFFSHKEVLAKNAQERYQTASCLEADLRALLRGMAVAWSHRFLCLGRPGTRCDASDRLLIHEKLFGRGREDHLPAFDRVVIRHNVVRFYP